MTTRSPSRLRRTSGVAKKPEERLRSSGKSPGGGWQALRRRSQPGTRPRSCLPGHCATQGPVLSVQFPVRLNLVDENQLLQESRATRYSSLDGGRRVLQVVLGTPGPVALVQAVRRTCRLSVARNDHFLLCELDHAVLAGFRQCAERSGVAPPLCKDAFLLTCAACRIVVVMAGKSGSGLHFLFRERAVRCQRAAGSTGSNI